VVHGINVITPREVSILSAKFTAICHQISCFATRCLLVTARELWWMNQERLELRLGMHNRSVMVAVHGTPCAIPPHNISKYMLMQSSEERDEQILLFFNILRQQLKSHRNYKCARIKILACQCGDTGICSWQCGKYFSIPLLITVPPSLHTYISLLWRAQWNWPVETLLQLRVHFLPTIWHAFSVKTTHYEGS
jgi:hypothetical protein